MIELPRGNDLLRLREDRLNVLEHTAEVTAADAAEDIHHWDDIVVRVNRLAVGA